MDEFTWWHAASFILLISNATFAVMVWEYRKRNKEMELSWRFDSLESAMHQKARSLQQDQEESTRAIWHALENVEDRLQVCQSRNCATNKR